MAIHPAQAKKYAEIKPSRGRLPFIEKDGIYVLETMKLIYDILDNDDLISVAEMIVVDSEKNSDMEPHKPGEHLSFVRNLTTNKYAGESVGQFYIALNGDANPGLLAFHKDYKTGAPCNENQPGRGMRVALVVKTKPRTKGEKAGEPFTYFNWSPLTAENTPEAVAMRRAAQEQGAGK